ncbi:MAG: DUF4870 domain-containing protein [Anaerolineae bacterium]
MDENKTPRKRAKRTQDEISEPIEDTLASLDETIETHAQAAADAAADADAAIETLADAAELPTVAVTEGVMPAEPTVTEPAEPTVAEPAEATVTEPAEPAVTEPVEATVDPLPEPLFTAPTPKRAAKKQPLSEYLAEESTFDPEATNDDRMLAGLSYASQLIFPLGFILPALLLLSESSKKRAFVRYHAIQSLGVGTIVWGLGLLYMLAFSTVGWLVALCLCFLLPVGVALWLLPLYYAMLAYNGKRFRIRGLTQFLEDQKWL